MKVSSDKILELLANLVGQYLAENGGYSNQYDTFVKGRIVPNQLGGITEFNTPGTYNLSMGHVKSLGDGLEREIKKLLSLYECEMTVILDADYIREGMYFQKVIIQQSKGVVIQNAPKPEPIIINDEKVEEENRKKKQLEIDAENKRKQDEEDRIRRQRQQDDEIAMMASITSMLACM